MARAGNLLPCPLDCTTDVPDSCRYVKGVYFTALGSAPATADAAADLATAERVATSRLLDSFSGKPGIEADALRGKVLTLLTGRSPDGSRRCATVGVQKDQVERGRKIAAEIAAFDQSLARAFAGLGRKRGSPLRRGRPLRVAVGKVTVDGTPGGTNGQWVAQHLMLGLEHAPEFAVVAMPSGWGGGRLPPGLDGLWTAVAFAHSSLDRDTAEVDCDLAFRDPARPRGPLLTETLVTELPSEAFPAHPLGTRRDPGTSVLTCGGFCVAIDTPAPGGGLCPGASSQVYLASDADGRALVFDLFGDDQALLVFPNDQHPRGAVTAGTKVELYPGGFTAVPYPGSPDERIVAFRASGASAFGPLASWRGSCRVPPPLARRLHDTPRTAIAGGRLRSADDAYRILPAASDACAQSPSPASGELEQALAAIPLCGR